MANPLVDDLIHGKNGTITRVFVMFSFLSSSEKSLTLIYLVMFGFEFRFNLLEWYKTCFLKFLFK